MDPQTQLQEQQPNTVPLTSDTDASGVAATQGGQDPQAAAKANIAQNPTVVQPVRRGGLAGIVDEIRDALAGTTTSKIYQDENGDKYVRNEPMSHGQQWVKIAATAAKGALAGLKAGRGKGGGPGAAGLAGIDSQLEDAAREKGARIEQNAEVKQQQLDKFNSIKLKHDIAQMEFEATRKKVEANESDVKFAESQIDRELKMGSADLGVYKDFADFAKVKEKNPNFWKDVYANNIVVVPELGPDGSRHGIHVFQRTQGAGNELVPDGSTVYDFMPPAKPGDKPQLVPRTINQPMTHNQLDAYNNAAYTKMSAWTKEQQELAASKSLEAERKANTDKAKAETGKAQAETEKIRKETQQIGKDATTADEQNTEKDIAEGLAEGRYTMGKDIPLRTTKGQTTAAQYTRMANEVSMKKYGLPYSPEIIRQEQRLAEAPKTQAFLTGIDRMVGTPGLTGQLDQVLDLAKKAGVGKSNAPMQELKLWIKQKMGSTAAKNFEEGLSDTQTALGTLIGNPLLGSGESDLKLKTAQKQFGSNVTLDNLIGAVTTTKEILTRARADLARNNRYIQQRYGEALSPTAQQQGNDQFKGPIRQGEQTAVGPQGQQIVARGGKWVDPTTGAEVK